MTLNPRSDIVFKKIFATETNKSILISFVNSVVSQEDQVADLTLATPYTIQNYKESKLSILDISAVTPDGRKFNIEMQVGSDNFYDKRALYYWTKLYSEQLSVDSKKYRSLMKTIGIHILDFSILSETKKYHSTFYMTEKDDGFRYFNDIEIHIIELPKFAGSENKMVSFMNNLDMWAGFLSQNEKLNLDQLPEKLDKDNLKRAFNQVDIMTFTAEERAFYDGQLDQIRVRESEILSAEINAKLENSIEIAKKMLEENMPIDMIIKLTSLTKEQIEKIKL